MKKNQEKTQIILLLVGMFLIIAHLEKPVEFLYQYLEKGITSIIILLEKIEPECTDSQDTSHAN